MKTVFETLGAAAGFALFVSFALMFLFTVWALAQ